MPNHSNSSSAAPSQGSSAIFDGAKGETEPGAAHSPTPETVEVTPQNAFRLALEMHREKRFTPAETLYRIFIAAEPDDPDANHFLGLLLCQTQRTEEGLTLMRRATTLAPDNPSVWSNIGNVLVRSGDAAGALAAYDRTLHLDENFAAAHANRGVVLRAAGDLAGAEASYRKAIELDPTGYEAWKNLAALLVATGRTEEAMGCAQRAKALAPRHSSVRRLLAAAYERAGMPKVAEEIYRDWLMEEPDNPFPRHLLQAHSETPPDRCSNAFVEHSFDEVGRAFDAKLGNLSYVGPSLVEEILNAVWPQAASLQVADVGCGTGLCAPVLRARADSLEGVDLSAEMLRLAYERGLYDALYKQEVTDFLASRAARYDLVVGADLLCYFGRLEGFAAATATALRDGGLIIATCEALAGEGDYTLDPSGRYTHGRAYIEASFAAARLTMVRMESRVLRTEFGTPVDSWVFAARKG